MPRTFVQIVLFLDLLTPVLPYVSDRAQSPVVDQLMFQHFQGRPETEGRGISQLTYSAVGALRCPATAKLVCCLQGSVYTGLSTLLLTHGPQTQCSVLLSSQTEPDLSSPSLKYSYSLLPTVHEHKLHSFFYCSKNPGLEFLFSAVTLNQKSQNLYLLMKDCIFFQ